MKSVRKIILALVIISSLVLAGCGVSKNDYNEVKSQLDEVQKNYDDVKVQLDSLQTNISNTQAQLTSVQSNYDTAKKQLDEAQAKIETLNGTVSDQATALKDAQDQANQLETKLNATLDTSITEYYRLNFLGNRYEWDLPVILRNYFNYKDKSRPGSMTAMITTDDAALNLLVGDIKDSSILNNLKKSDTINLVAKLIQNIPRINKEVTTVYDNYPRYPIETIVEQAGDSQDAAILTATILKMLEYDVVFFSYGSPQHIAVGVYMPGTGGYGWEYKGKRYSYLETTGETYVLGDCPPQYRTTPMEIIEISG
jgi:outer membrane murein-binding lipoprotein Lpp